MKSRKLRGGNFTLAALGKAAMDALIPATLFYAVTRLKSRKNRSKRSRRYFKVK